MLNYIWLSLIAIGIFVAAGSDISDLTSNRYHNGEELHATVILTASPTTVIQKGEHYPCTVLVSGADASSLYSLDNSPDIALKGDLIPGENNSGILRIVPDEKFPALWQGILKAQKSNDFLLAKIRWDNANGSTLKSRITFEDVKFVKMNAVTNDGIIKSAKTAVELSIGLIGIMALWLGIMKIAEQSGLIASLGKLLRPVTTRIFPEVPADHPAMGAMIMNISANMLGLSNAATPFGLKAMEELDKLNTKKGTATDAMCIFLVINTGNLQLIPATVIAIRAAAGSSNPTEILGPVIVATFITLVVGVTTAKALGKLPVFKRQLT